MYILWQDDAKEKSEGSSLPTTLEGKLAAAGVDTEEKSEGSTSPTTVEGKAVATTGERSLLATKLLGMTKKKLEQG